MLEKLPEFVDVQEFANKVGPAINVWEEESFGDFTVNPQGLLFTREEMPSFTYRDTSGREVVVQLDDTSDPIQVNGVYTKLDDNWWGVDCYEVYCSNRSPADDCLTAKRLGCTRLLQNSRNELSRSLL